MIDDDDVTSVALMTLLSDGPVMSMVGLAFLIVVLVWQCQDADTCAQMHCPLGQTPKVMKHDCLCVTEAKP